MKIFIDAGHNYSGADTGARGNGLKEQDITFAIADKLRALFISAGHSVKMSRNKLTDNIGRNGTESVNARPKIANEWGADLHLSIHCNAFNGCANGTECLVYSFGSRAATYAEGIQEDIVTTLGTKSRGVKERKDLAALRLTSMPAVLIETAFIDHAGDAALLKDRQDDFAAAIFRGITGESVQKEKEEMVMEQTVMKLPEEVYVQEINPADFDILVCDCKKRSVGRGKYFNAGFFAAQADGSTVPVGNLAGGGKVIAQAKDNPDWINVAGKALTTIYTTKDGTCGLVKTDSLSSIQNLQAAVSGIPIIANGKRISYDEITGEGYFGSELYDTWHGFLGIRHNKLVYVAMKCGFEEMCWALVALGIYDAVKLDGGGSFILHDVKELTGTGENRRIHNVGVWTS